MQVVRDAGRRQVVGQATWMFGTEARSLGSPLPGLLFSGPHEDGSAGVAGAHVAPDPFSDGFDDSEKLSVPERVALLLHPYLPRVAGMFRGCQRPWHR